VVNATAVLIFKKVFDNEKDYYESYKGNKDPNNAFIIFPVQFFVLFIGKCDYDHKGQKKKNGKN